jgi:hypothetical protein
MFYREAKYEKIYFTPEVFTDRYLRFKKIFYKNVSKNWNTKKCNVTLHFDDV